MSVFGEKEQVYRSWCGVADVDDSTVAAWEKSIQCANTGLLQTGLSKQELKPILSRYQEFIAMADQDLSAVGPEIGIPHFFLVTDPNGHAIHFVGPTEILENLRSYNVHVGTSFAMEQAGINGISFAMKMQSTVVVQGVQHTIPLLHDWTCICAPVYLFEQIYGYIDISFPTEMDVTFAVPLLKKTIEEIEGKLKKSTHCISSEAAADALFEPFNLSNREKEVAFGWLQNKSVLQMSHTMGITEGTVRNMLKKVYAKTGVSDKGQFFRKFLA